MSFFSYAWDWVTTGQLARRLRAPAASRSSCSRTSATAPLPLLIAALIGIPAGVAIGHRGGRAPSS